MFHMLRCFCFCWLSIYIIQYICLIVIPAHFTSDKMISLVWIHGIPCDCSLKTSVLNCWTICSVVDWEVNPQTADPCGEAPLILVTNTCFQSNLCKWSHIHIILKGLDVVSNIFVQTASFSIALQQSKLFRDKKWSESRPIKALPGQFSPFHSRRDATTPLRAGSELCSKVLMCLCKCSQWWFTSSNPAVPGRWTQIFIISHRSDFTTTTSSWPLDTKLYMETIQSCRKLQLYAQVSILTTKK